MLWTTVAVVLAAGAAHGRRVFPPIDHNVTEFGLRLMQLLPFDMMANSVFSPFGVYMQIVLLHVGSGGHTSEELARLSGSRNKSERALIDPAKQLLYQIRDWRARNVFAMANVMLTGPDTPVTYFIQRRFSDRNVKATIRNISDYTPLEVNRWAEAVTGGWITQLVDKPPRPDTQIMLLDGVHFRGLWKEAFTYPHMGQFVGADNSRRTASFMRKLGDVEHVFHEGYNADVLSLPLSGSFLKFVIVVPRDKFGIWRVKALLNGGTLNSLIRMLTTKKVELYVPRFQFEMSYDLRKPLDKLGVKSLFTGWAILWKVSPVKGIHVTDILHKARITLNEQGEAAAPVSDGVPAAVVVRADHPFLFFVTAGQRNALVLAGDVNKAS